MTEEIILSTSENSLVKSSLIELLKRVPEFQVWLAKQKSPATKRNYKIALREFTQIMGIENFEQLKEIDLAHIIYFRDKLIEKGQSNRTVNVRLSAISSLYKHLIGRGKETGIYLNPVKEVPRPTIKQDQYETIVLTEEEVRRILSQVDPSTLQGLRDQAILGVLFNTGCRIGEIGGLRISDYFITRGAWHLRFKVKGQKINPVAINAKTIMYLNTYLAASGHGGKENRKLPLFLPLKTSGVRPDRKKKELTALRSLCTYNFCKIWHKYADQAGVHHSHPHTARATFITLSLENGAPIQNVQETVGHAFISTTQGYYKRSKRPENSATHHVSF